MGKAKINDLYEQAHVVHEIPYESSVVDPSIVSVHKQRVFDRYLFAELIVRQMLEITDAHTEVFQTDRDRALVEHIKKSVTQHFGIEE